MTQPLFVGKPVFFTGHRPKDFPFPMGSQGYYDYTGIVIERIKELAIAWYDHGYRSFISGMAVGFDQLAFMGVHQARATHPDIVLVAAIPFVGQESKWPTRVQENYHQMLSLANTTIAVCDPGYAPWKMQKRNEWMVDHGQLGVALLDATKPTGGTRNCIAYAASQGKHVHVLDLHTLMWV